MTSCQATIKLRTQHNRWFDMLRWNGLTTCPCQPGGLMRLQRWKENITGMVHYCKKESLFSRIFRKIGCILLVKCSFNVKLFLINFYQLLCQGHWSSAFKLNFLKNYILLDFLIARNKIDATFIPTRWYWLVQSRLKIPTKVGHFFAYFS